MVVVVVEVVVVVVTGVADLKERYLRGKKRGKGKEIKLSIH